MSIEDVWRRAGVPMATLYHIAAADGVHSLGLSRGAMRLGRSKACAMEPCRSLPPRMTVRASCGRKHWSRASRLRR